MFRSMAPLGAAALLLSGCGGAPPDSQAFDEAEVIEEVTEAMNGLTVAMNSHDSEQVFAFYRQDESFFFLGCTDILFGWGTFASRVGPFYDNSPDFTLQREILSVQALTPVTAVVSLRGSSSEGEALFWTHVLKKAEDGRWLVTYEHESWPGCSVPRGPHMGTEGMGPGATPASPEAPPGSPVGP